MPPQSICIYSAHTLSLKTLPMLSLHSSIIIISTAAALAEDYNPGSLLLIKAQHSESLGQISHPKLEPILSQLGHIKTFKRTLPGVTLVYTGKMLSISITIWDDTATFSAVLCIIFSHMQVCVSVSFFTLFASSSV